MTTSPQIPAYNGDHTVHLAHTGTFTIHHGADPSQTFDVITAVIPAEDSFIVRPHYHSKATEWMKIVQGHAEGVIAGEKRTLKAGDDWLELPPGTRFHKQGGKHGVKVTWLERSGPDPEQKKRFFEDFMGSGEPSGFFHSMACFYRDGDSFISLPGAPYTDPLGWFLVYVVGGLVNLTGLCGRRVYGEGKVKAT